MEINCGFKNHSYYSDNLYTCNINEASITEHDHVIKEFKGDHEAGKNNYDVQCVSFYSLENVNHFPRGLKKHFPNLTNLDINYCGIKEITRYDLIGLDGLVHLYIQTCELTILPDDLFIDMKNLREVSFYCNKVEFVSSKLLKPLLGRENVKVDLRLNKEIDAYYEQGKKGSLRSLEELMKLIDEKCMKPNFYLDPAVFRPPQPIAHPGHSKLFQPVVHPGPVNFNPKLKEMWISGKFSDLTIVAGEKDFKVHKNILGMENPIFAKIFEDQLEATKIKIPGFSSDAVGALLKFIYTNEATEDGNAKENLDIADKFKVAAMKSIYEEIIFDQVDDANAWETFIFAQRVSSQVLKEKSFKVIAEKIPEDLPDELMDDPENLKEMIDARGVYDDAREVFDVARRAYQEVLSKLKNLSLNKE